MVAKPTFKICGESDFETTRIVLRFELNQIEHSFIDGERGRVRRSLIDRPAASQEFGPYRCSFRLSDEGNQLISTGHIAPLDRPNV